MGPCRLKVNIAKFATENSGMWESETSLNRNNEKKGNFMNKQKSYNAKVSYPGGGLSFRDAIDGKSKSSAAQAAGLVDKTLEVPMYTSAFSELYGKALIGRVVDVRTLVDMGRVLGDCGLEGVEISYIGGLALMLNFVNSNEAAEFLLRVEEWSRWFSVLDRWEGQSFPFERLAWLKIHGVPLNLTVNDVFDSIAGKFGKVVHPSQVRLEDGNISAIVVGVLVGEGDVIFDHAILRWRDKAFKVWVIEDLREWDPECTGVFASVGKCGKKKKHVGPSKHKPISCPSDEKNRPKKRSRNDLEDPFDLNRLLGINTDVLTQEKLEENGDNRAEGVVNGDDLDLNTSVEEVSSDHSVASGSVLVADQEDEGVVGVERLVAKEMEETVELGIGGLVKGPWVGIVRRKESINFVALQESKFSVVSEADVRHFWGGGRFVMDSVGSVGVAGGVVSMWDPLVFEAEESHKDPNFLLVRGKLKGNGEKLNVMNVYAPQSSSAKALLWSKIDGLVNSYQGMWLIAGDFNVVRFPEEIRNSVYKAGQARKFNEFIYNTGLKEYDHSPLILSMKQVNFGPRPFRVFNSWLSKPGFEDAVSEAVESYSGNGTPDMFLTNKFAYICGWLRRWRDDMIKKEKEEEAVALSDLEGLESVMESRELQEEEVWTMGECKKVLKSVGLRRCLDLKQRSSNRNWDFIPASKNSSGVWRAIVKSLANTVVEGVPIRRMFKGIVGDGSDIAFWIDPWLSDMPLKDMAPGLFSLEKFKKCKVKERIIDSGGSVSVRWKWKHRPTETEVLGQLAMLNGLFDELSGVFSSRKDRWHWLGIDASNNFVLNWCKWIPVKCNMFAWRAALGGIPTSVSLMKRHVPVADPICQLCGFADESVDHIFTSCLVASVLWQGISQWCKVPYIYAFSFGDLLELHNFTGLKGMAKEVFQGLIVIGCWALWKARNELRFSNKPVNAGNILSEVKAVGFLWFSNRGRLKSISWENWCFSIM
ncbi:RNA-directed DNA polymerase, eukaryota, Nucleotide-binding alpha-beta plait domain protein [Artemisia annua]|uniref:RNA-directed DNA polymerase, eukaryota, Nucleotide-binding alpha-beta plait domain protein n=1 Tax=Artemisia annua TaxID=35608 RepID=A0A2U1NV10_ARTAN|nr:RNA-directed DNA polymerase, eukaryota, Nucleotide-binding alpha-beta plait domain protein [Artemisia annua]